MVNEFQIPFNFLRICHIANFSFIFLVWNVVLLVNENFTATSHILFKIVWLQEGLDIDSDESFPVL